MYPAPPVTRTTRDRASTSVSTVGSLRWSATGGVPARRDARVEVAFGPEPGRLAGGRARTPRRLPGALAVVTRHRLAQRVTVFVESLDIAQDGIVERHDRTLPPEGPITPGGHGRARTGIDVVRSSVPSRDDDHDPEVPTVTEA